MPLTFVDAAQVEVGNMSLALPFGQLTRFDPYYPAAFVGAEHRWLDKRVVDVAQVARFGGFRHGLFGTSMMLGTDTMVRATTGFGLAPEGGLGITVSDQWRAREVLRWDDDDGTYAPSNDPGTLGVTLGFTIGLGLDLSELSGPPLTPYLAYRWFVQTPFLPALAVGPQGCTNIGIRWAFGGGE